MKKHRVVDFLINYEHKAREFDAVCLIRIELERRGYTVDFTCTYDEDRVRFMELKLARVVITSALYNDACLYGFVYSIAGSCKKVVNLQWEQSLTNQDESDPLFYQNPKEYAREALHLCWGEEPKNRLLRAGLSPDRAVVVGPVQMDTLRPEFEDLFLHKAELAYQFELDVEKQWVLFISSFTFVNMSDEEYNKELICMGERLDDFRRISIQSKQQVIVWLETAMLKHPEQLFIYRPHPSENGDESLDTLEAKYPNFRVIKELSVKQWIKSCDQILTWYSTSAAEVFYAGKSCSILRPVEIPYEWEVSVYRNARLIKELDAFLSELEHPPVEFPLDPGLINSYYQVQEALPSYVRVCDILEQVLRTTRFDMRHTRPFCGLRLRVLRTRARLFFLCKEALARTDYRALLLNNRRLVQKMESHLAVMDRLNRDRSKNQATPEETVVTLAKVQSGVMRYQSLSVQRQTPCSEK